MNYSDMTDEEISKKADKDKIRIRATTNLNGEKYLRVTVSRSLVERDVYRANEILRLWMGQQAPIFETDTMIEDSEK